MDRQFEKKKSFFFTSKWLNIGISMSLITFVVLEYYKRQHLILESNTRLFHHYKVTGNTTDLCVPKAK